MEAFDSKDYNAYSERAEGKYERIFNLLSMVSDPSLLSLRLKDLISPSPEQRAVSVTVRPGAGASWGHPLK